MASMKQSVTGALLTASPPFPCILPSPDLSTHPARNKRLQSHIRLEHKRAAQYHWSPFSPSIKYQPYGILNSSSQHFQIDIIWKLLSFRTTPSSSIIYWGIKHKHRNTTGRFHSKLGFCPLGFGCWSGF